MNVDIWGPGVPPGGGRSAHSAPIEHKWWRLTPDGQWQELQHGGAYIFTEEDVGSHIAQRPADWTPDASNQDRDPAKSPAVLLLTCQNCGRKTTSGSCGCPEPLPVSNQDKSAGC